MENTASFVCITVLLVAAIVVYMCMGKAKGIVEGYRDNIWTNPQKMYTDYYPRASGSIYGTPLDGWNMFSGYPAYTRAI